MSFFLGPIHHWLFSKIKTAEAREAYIVSECAKKFGEDVEKISEEARGNFGDYISEPLEKMVEGKPIHGTLGELIDIANTRESAIVSGLISKFGDPAREAVYNAANEHGKLTAVDVLKTGNPPEDAKEAFKLLFDWLLDALPCDQVVQVRDDRKANVEWIMSFYHLEADFKKGGSDVPTQAGLILSWKKGFVDALGSSFTLNGEVLGDGSISCKIELGEKAMDEVIAKDALIGNDMVINQVIADYPSTLEVFNRYGLDTCCGGAETIEQNSKNQGLGRDKIDAMVRELNELVA